MNATMTEEEWFSLCVGDALYLDPNWEQGRVEGSGGLLGVHFGPAVHLIRGLEGVD
jgi:hypothetical protein